MIEAYADGELFYDSRTETTKLLGLRATPSLDMAGTAEIIMPAGHPAYDRFIHYRTLVEITRRDALIFRGRALYHEDNTFNTRTVVCEGERSFFRDSVMLPYLYQDTPEIIFSDIVARHNSQVEQFKTFKVGTITVTDANDYVRLESETAEQTSDTLDKLVERCGGYITFTTNAQGERCVNWLEKLEYRSNQAIEFGENLLEFARYTADTGLATRVYPYGARDLETGQRISIASVNSGLEYVEDAEAVALRGVISIPVFWDDVTLPENLLTKAQKYLATSKMLITTLSLSTVDLSALDKDIDTFLIGDHVQVVSRPHNVDDTFLLRERTYDLLNPANDTIILGKELLSLTSAGASGDRDVMNQLHKTEHNIKSDYTVGIEQAIAATERTLSSLIQQAADSIRLEISETYTTNDQLESRLSTTLTQLADSFSFEFESLKAVVDENDASTREQFETIHSYIRFVDGNILLGKDGNLITLRIQNDRIIFLDGGAEVAYFSNKQLYVLDGHFINSLRIGNFALMPRQNGNLSLVRARNGLIIAEQPKSVTIRKGESATMTIRVPGENLMYEWQTSLDGAIWMVGVPSESPDFTMTWPADQNTFAPTYCRCIVTDASGKHATSQTATFIPSNGEVM